MLLLACILATFAVLVVQCQITFRDIPTRVQVGSRITVTYIRQQDSGEEWTFPNEGPLDIIADGEGERALERRIKTRRRTRVGVLISGRQDLRVAKETGIYRVRALYTVNGFPETDVSSPFTAFASDDPTSSSTEPIRTTSHSSSRETSESSSSSTTSLPFPTPTTSTTGTQLSINPSTATRSPVTGSAALASTSDANPSSTNTTSSDQANNTSEAGIIAGSVIAFMTVVGVFSFFVVRRCRKQRRIERLVEPYVFFRPRPPQKPSRGILKVSQQQQPEATEEVVVIGQLEEGITETREAEAEAEDRAAHTPERVQERKSVVVHHEDSGWRPVRASALQPTDARVVDLPPDYDAAR